MKKGIWMLTVILILFAGNSMMAQRDSRIKVNISTMIGAKLKSPIITEIDDDKIRYFSRYQTGELPYTDIRTIEVIDKRNSQRRALKGIGIGALAGGIIGVIAVPKPRNLLDAVFVPVAWGVYGMLGVAVGGTVGYFVGKASGGKHARIDFHGKSTHEQILKLKQKTAMF